MITIITITTNNRFNSVNIVRYKTQAAQTGHMIVIGACPAVTLPGGKVTPIIATMLGVMVLPPTPHKPRSRETDSRLVAQLPASVQTTH